MHSNTGNVNHLYPWPLAAILLLGLLIFPAETFAQSKQQLSLEDSIRLSQKFIDHNNYKTALEKLQQTRKRDQRDYQYLVRNAWLYAQLKQYPQAEDYYRRASMANYSAIEPLIGLCNSQMAQGKWADAKRSARLITSKSTNHYTGLTIMAQASFELGEYTESANAYQRIQRFYPSDSAAIEGEAWAALAMKQYDKVNELSLELLKLAQNDSSAWSLHGWVAMNRKEYTIAETNFLRAIELQSNNTSAITGLGWLYYKKKMYSNAYTRFQQAYRMNPNNIEAISGLAWTHYFQQQFDKSQPYMQKLYQLRPNDKDVKQAMIYLKNRQRNQQGWSRS